jgi:ribosomal protein L11
MEIKSIFSIDRSKFLRKLDLVIPAQQAKFGPPVGPVLGQVKKIKIKDFCASFNDSTLKFKIGLPLRVLVFIYKDVSFNYIIRPPFTMFLIKNVINPNKTISILNIYKITLMKKLEIEFLCERIIFRNILFTLKFMNITIE